MSSFREKVYRVVKKIPKGKIMTYKKVAKAVGSSRAWRAVGNALNKNEDPKIPCHRVIKSNGEIGGYRKGAKKKVEILKKEGIIIKNGKITPRPTK
jgi:O-6-methylguanine DNA methyltransferase